MNFEVWFPSFIPVVIYMFRLDFKRVPYFFKKTYQPLLYLVPCRMDDETRSFGDKIRPGKHHPSGRELRYRGRFIMICLFEKIWDPLIREYDAERYYDNHYKRNSLIVSYSYIS